jgi:phosphoribosylaminoimidazolecarboxamide formyltransferase / IMP cyclohydrolase
MKTSDRHSESPKAQDPAEVSVKLALLTVSDKRGIVEFARGLRELGIDVVSTGGTAQKLAQAGVEVRSIEDYTGFPEILDGRVKTLNPRIYAGVLAVRSEADHLATLQSHDIEPIDLVCVNLYPFESAAAKSGVTESEVVENIDIGGPTLIRAGAKNYSFVGCVVDPDRYETVLDELSKNERKLSLATRRALATEAFSHTARYDAAISQWFSQGEDFPTLRVRAHEKVFEVPYGENPHQKAAYYADSGSESHLLAGVSQLHGKELSFNNLLDLDSARRLSEEFELPAAVIVKHNNPCGCAVSDSVQTAYEKALATDPISAFGGVFCLNRRVDAALARRLHEIFVELVFAPGYDQEALEILRDKPNIRILEDRERRYSPRLDQDVRRIRGGVLVQDRDEDLEPREQMQVVTERQPSEQEWGNLLFSWRVAKHVRSNAIVFGKDLATAGIGAGQMSRVDSVRLAIEKANVGLDDSVMASDAFFPFPDGPQAGIDAGVRALIQPGGSRRDQEVIDACDAAHVAMVFTGRRHFRH